MIFTQQIKNDIVQALVWLGLCVVAMYAAAFFVAEQLSISLDNARPVVGSWFLIAGLAYIFREMISSYKEIVISAFLFLMLVGFYGAGVELYEKHFTLLGMGKAPVLFHVSYLLGCAACFFSTAYFVKRNFFE